MGRIITAVTIEGLEPTFGEVPLEPTFGEVPFVDMTPRDGVYEPLIGYLPLEHSQAAVDMLGHCLVHVKRVDLKGVLVRTT